MPNPNAIVAGVSRIDPPIQRPTAEFLNNAPPAGVVVHFDDGRIARLDPGDPRSTTYAEVLDELRRMIVSAYVEVNPANNAITRLLVPLVVRVTDILPTPSGDMEVELEISHARHILKRTNPDYDELIQTLQTARAQSVTLSVTETENDHEIIDVRPAPNPTTPAVQAVATTPPASLSFALPAVTPQTAQQMFVLVSNQTCDPVAVPPPCIPFLFPDDGCWGRAHQMCRLMSAAGEQSGKVWIYGRLQVNTRNNPTCQVNWGWHVVPTLQVNTGAGVQLQVIDPALFTGPVPEGTWKGVQGDPSATLALTDSSVFYRSPAGAVQTDPTYAQTAQVLATYRLQLQLRSTSAVGPPPYHNCP
jgi:hypothetical protein